MARYRSTRKAPTPTIDELTNVVSIRAAQRKRTAQPETTVAVADSPAEVIGANERAVIDQCALSGMTERRPATVMQARAMARILDDPDRKHDHPKASAEQHKLLESLDPPKKRKSGGRLASVKAMSGNAKSGNIIRKAQ